MSFIHEAYNVYIVYEQLLVFNLYAHISLLANIFVFYLFLGLFSTYILCFCFALFIYFVVSTLGASFS